MLYKSCLTLIGYITDLSHNGRVYNRLSKQIMLYSVRVYNV